jgi:hypothetical protein
MVYFTSAPAYQAVYGVEVDELLPASAGGWSPSYFDCMDGLRIEGMQKWVWLI